MKQLTLLTALLIVVFSCTPDYLDKYTRDDDFENASSLLSEFIYRTDLQYYYPKDLTENTDNKQVIEHSRITLSYNEAHEQPNWVIHKLRWAEIENGTVIRTDDFREDPLVLTQSASLDDYSGSGYDRGHLAPAADFNYHEVAMSESFYLSNMSPQVDSFNRGIWKSLEEKVRTWASEFEELIVVTGPVLADDLSTIGSNNVSVPDKYYKIIFYHNASNFNTIAFLMNNEESSEDLTEFIVSIDYIEELTNINFFSNLPKEDQSALEKNISSENWFD